MIYGIWFEVCGERVALLANERVVVVEGETEHDRIEASSSDELAAFLKEEGKLMGVDVVYSHETERGERAMIRVDEGSWALATRV